MAEEKTVRAELQMDFTSFTIGDLEDFQEKTGHDLTRGENFVPTLNDLKTFAWIIRRREQPEYAFDETRDLMLSEITGMMEGLRAPNAGAAPAAALRNGSHPSPSSTAGARRTRSGV